MSDSVWPHPWDSPGKNTGVGCHFLLQCIKVKSESEVSQSYLTLRNPMGCSLPGSSVHGIFQARVLEWDAIAFSEESLWGGSKWSWGEGVLLRKAWKPCSPPLLPCPKDLLHFTVSDFILYLNVRTVSKRFPEFGSWFDWVFEHGVGVMESSTFSLLVRSMKH